MISRFLQSPTPLPDVQTYEEVTSPSAESTDVFSVYPLLMKEHLVYEPLTTKWTSKDELNRLVQGARRVHGGCVLLLNAINASFSSA